MVEPVDLEDLGRAQADRDKLLETIEAGPSTRALMAIASKVQWGCSPGDVSLLHVLRYIQAVGGLDHMLAVEGGQQQDRITETTQKIAHRLAELLGDRVVLDTRVRRISQDDNGVTVHTDDGPGVLMAFCVPRVYDGFSPEVRRGRVTRQLVDLFGAQASEPIDLHVRELRQRAHRAARTYPLGRHQNHGRVGRHHGRRRPDGSGNRRTGRPATRRRRHPGVSNPPSRGSDPDERRQRRRSGSLRSYMADGAWLTDRCRARRAQR